MTVKQICFKCAIILIWLHCQELCAEIRFCNLNTTENVNNICGSSNYLVHISESSCGASNNTNCWCILVDNRHQEYDGQLLKIEMDHLFRVTSTGATQTNSESNSLHVKFIISPGINQIYVEPVTYLSPTPNIMSFKIDDHESCKLIKRQKRQIDLYNQQGMGNNYQYLNDCLLRRGYTANSEHYCQNDDRDFVIEKRILTSGDRYWCIVINNENNVFSSANLLRITYSSRNKFVAWIPSDAYFKQNSGDSFTLGSRQTVVAVSQNNGVLSDLTMVTIDDQSICNYFRKTAPLPPQFTTAQYKPPVNLDKNRYPIIWKEVFDTEQPKQPEQVPQDKYSNLNDCKQTRIDAAVSDRFCNSNNNNLVIEKRILMRGDQYWCIMINNEKNLFTSENRLKIAFTDANYRMAWAPSEAKETSSDSFTLGDRQTVIAVSANTGKVPDLITVTINGQSICNYFNTPEIKPSPPSSNTMIYKPIVNNTILPTPTYEEPPIEPQNKPTFSEKCGIKPSKRPLTLIAHGLDTKLGEWPWHAAIYKLQSKLNRNYVCGGTLIDRKTIVTAAHCILDMNLIVIPDRIIVELGRYDLSIATYGLQEFKVFEVKPHEFYNPDTLENDIAILILANYVQLTKYVNFICLPEPNMDLQRLIGKTVGWGRDQNNQQQIKLKEASLPVIDNIMCLSSNREFFGQFLTKSNFCAGYRNKTNVCIGDSGGGLVFEIDNHWILGGITSLGVSSKSTDVPCDITQYSLFTDVTKFAKWIKQNS